MLSRDIETIRKLMAEFKLIQSYEKMLKNYEWFSLASGINDDAAVLKIMKQLKGDY